MDLLTCLRLLYRNWLLILISLIIGVISAVWITANTPPKYAAAITLMVKSAKVDALGAHQPISTQQVKSYANLLSSRRLISQIAETENEIGALQQNITAQVIPDTLLLQATITHGDPIRAVRLADALGARLATMVEEMERPTPGSSPSVTLAVVDPPSVPSGPISPKPLVNVAYGLLIALFIGIGSIFLRDHLDTTIKTSEMLQRLAQSYMLGIIGYDKDAQRHPLVVHNTRSPLRAEAYRSLCGNLQFIDTDRQPKSLVVTSCLPREGKSSTASNLAIALAQAGRRVILIDGDLRHPRIRDYFGINSEAGLTDVLIGKAQLGQATQQWGKLDLYVLPSGQIPPNPSELLGSRGMRQVLEELVKSYDMVIIDAPPLLNLTDAATLAGACDGTMLVVRYGKTRQEHVVRAKELLSSVDACVVGAVLNAVPARAIRCGHGRAKEPKVKREVTMPVSG
ncbi:polysaccharide biosynthesis tyrosine autokinase [Nonomuraea sp. SYSU D8015]|uniref:polysaccharide biosynthesis tyrosine autokinase n=1 Tax=Nonomuraea sp. SYSU D8015 TaxID=2593644 RepID=UPI0016616D95|nr:polysaccharide biosynthesis tyrosine autokinase [Nonomuraea sp. SYSU D8015]